MKNILRSAALAAGALVCLTASQAFAGLELVSTQSEPDSWSMTYNATIDSVLTTFNRIEFIRGPGVNYTVTGTNYSIATPSYFEDISGGGGHKGVQDWTALFGATTTGWGQTFIDVPAAGSDMKAAGNTNNVNGSTLAFKVYFTGDPDDGAHYYMNFYQDATFVSGYEVKNIIDAVKYPDHPQGLEITNYLTLVPLPGSVWSGMALMGGLGLVLARRRRSAIVA